VASGSEGSFFLEHGFEDVRRERGRIVRLAVGNDIVWDMLPYPAARRSIISPRAFDDLRAHGLAPTPGLARAVVRGLPIADQPVPDLEVRVSAAVTRLKVDGFLGLDFFEQFELVQWNPRSHRVTLVSS